MRREGGPVEGVIGRILDAVRRRLLIRDLLHAVAAAAAGAIVIAAALRAQAITVRSVWLWMVVILVAGVAAGLFVRRRARDRAVAARMVDATYALHNVVVTAEQLQRQPGHSAEWVRARVFSVAANHLQQVDRSRVVPLRRPAVSAAIVLTALVAAHVLAPGGRVSGAFGPDGPAPVRTATVDGGIRIDLEPPAYSGLPARTLDNPPVIEALEGTRGRMTIASESAQVRIGSRVLSLARLEGRVRADVTLTESTYLAIDLPDHDRSTLIPVTVTPDSLPSVRIAAPGRDLLLPAVRASIGVAATATDDLALRAMSLRYTKVSGSGEQFEFVEGELPLRIARDSDRAWKADGEIPLMRLGLGPGDSLVYRVTAHDARPGNAGAGSSETFFVEIAGPGQIALEGLDMPQERDRYALSQQMVVLKIQRLRDREPSLSRTAVQAEAATIAAEQRAVRANFVFLMGGHVEDEEQEAEQSHEIQEGRLENAAWRDMSRAIAHMTGAEQGLIGVDTRAALTAAKLAVEALQRAFGRSRYFVRTVPVRSRLDPTRRLSGRLDDVRGTDREIVGGTADERDVAVRALLADVLKIAAAVRRQRANTHTASALTRLAERALAVRAAGSEFQQVAQDLVQARDAALQSPASPELRQRLDRLVDVLTARARASAANVSAQPDSAGRLRGAWAEEAGR
jgi:hypothetical protein